MPSAPRPALLLLDDELRVTWSDPAACRRRGMRPDAPHGAALAQVLRATGAHERFVLERDAACRDGGYRLAPLEADEDGRARLAHDLRTPLNAMAGWLHLIGTPREVAPGMRERALVGLRTAVEQQLRLIATLDEPPAPPPSGR